MLGHPCPGDVDTPDSRYFRRSRDLTLSPLYEQESGQTILDVSPSGLHNPHRCPTCLNPSDLLHFNSTRILRQNNHCLCKLQRAKGLLSDFSHCLPFFYCLEQFPSDIPSQYCWKNNVHKFCSVTIANLSQDFDLSSRLHCGCLDTRRPLVKYSTCPSTNHRNPRGVKTIPAISHPLTGCGQGNAIIFTPASTQLL